VQAAKLLLSKGADIKATNMKGNTPLHEACHNGKLEILHALLEGGSDVHAKVVVAARVCLVSGMCRDMGALCVVNIRRAWLAQAT